MTMTMNGGRGEALSGRHRRFYEADDPYSRIDAALSALSAVCDLMSGGRPAYQLSEVMSEDLQLLLTLIGGEIDRAAEDWNRNDDAETGAANDR